MSTTGPPKFQIGRLCATPNALHNVNLDDMTAALERHKRGDWGELDEEDRAENDRSLREGFRLLSAYTDRKGRKFWIITEADRSLTTILLPEDY